MQIFSPNVATVHTGKSFYENNVSEPKKSSCYYHSNASLGLKSKEKQQIA